MNRKRERKSIETIYTSHRIEFIYIALFNIVIDMLGEIPEAPPPEAIMYVSRWDKLSKPSMRKWKRTRRKKPTRVSYVST